MQEEETEIMTTGDQVVLESSGRQQVTQKSATFTQENPFHQKLKVKGQLKR